MATSSPLQRFVEIIDKSGLPDSRRDYWLDLISRGLFDEKSFQELDREMQAHYAELELALRVKEAQLEDDQAEKAEIEEKLFPIVQTYVENQPALIAEDEKALKADYMSLYDEMMKELQVASTSQKTEDIEAIRKFLAGGKAQNDNTKAEGDDESDDIQDAA